MKAEIIAVGTELLMGYVVNTNASWMAQELLDIGIGTYYQQVVGDNPNRMREAIKLATDRSDIVIISGGLGPTRDDVTKQVVADFVGASLIYDQKQYDKGRQHYAKRGNAFTSMDAKQAEYIEGSEVFFNHVGIACGFGLVHKTQSGRQVMIMVVPGPPFEMKEMIKRSAKPFILEHHEQDHVIRSLYLNFYGRGEAIIARDLDDLIQSQTNPTIALYAKPNRVTARLTASASSSDIAEEMNHQLAEQILDLTKDYFIGYGEEYNLEQFIVETLKEHGHTISVAESLTGGGVMQSLTEIPGASSVFYGGFVTYQNQAKEDLLGLTHETIERHTVVSEEVAIGMAESTLRQTGTTFALALTGVAGPDSLEGHAPGDYYIALAIHGEKTQCQFFSIGDRPRSIIQDNAKHHALNMVRQFYKNK